MRASCLLALGLLALGQVNCCVVKQPCEESHLVRDRLANNHTTELKAEPLPSLYSIRDYNPI